MKKIVKLLAALGLISLMVSFAGCGLKTEAELLNGSTTRGGETNGGESSPLWSSFEGADMQVWVPNGSTETTADVAQKPDCIEITIKNLGWWGMCFCNDKAVGAGPDAVTFDMSQVASITFDAKASQTASMWAAQMPSGLDNQQRIELSTDFAEKTFNLSNPTNHDYGVLAIGGGDLETTVTTGVVISIKNIKFLNAAGTEITPSRNE
jgi:hypothetical protein